VRLISLVSLDLILKKIGSRLDERTDGDEIQDYLAGKTGQRSVPNVFVSKS
jgi:glutaredoxin